MKNNKCYKFIKLITGKLKDLLTKLPIHILINKVKSFDKKFIAKKLKEFLAQLLKTLLIKVIIEILFHFI